MNYIIKSLVKEDSANILIRGFYDFYNKLHGKESVRALNILKPHFSMDEKIRNFIDSLDSNLNLAVDSVEEINTNSKMMILYIYDDSKKLLGFSRFTYEKDALTTSEIILIEETKELTPVDIYLKTIEFYEEKAKEIGFSKVNLEVPVFDINYFCVAQQSSYDVVEPTTKNNLLEGKTVLFEKELNRNRSDDFGRNLINKQD